MGLKKLILHMVLWFCYQLAKCLPVRQNRITFVTLTSQILTGDFKLLDLSLIHIYIVNGYRDSIFYNKTFLDHPAQTLYFWAVVIILFVIGCALMYKFKRKFIDMI